MQTARKIRLLPTPEQEELFWKSAGVARWAYNYFLSEQEKQYQIYLKNGETGTRFVKEGEVRKYINNVLKKTTHTWLSDFALFYKTCSCFSMFQRDLILFFLFR